MLPNKKGPLGKASLFQMTICCANWIIKDYYSPSFARISRAAVAMTVPGPYTPATPAS